ncbi:hypothetical protein P271_146 [Malacoplasma iowae DK-CPA]|uniref:Uncharacterized protein n=2 Tax=Malacoplasma iowae TaxID=2116 RepID=A0A084U2X9_MALIO|nr:hypothetical protein P271_146 [Malacoplasma iowae DK-CPA]
MNMKKFIKKWILPISASLLGISVVATGIYNNVDHKNTLASVNLNNSRKTRTEIEQTNPILSNSKTDVKQATKNGFLTKDNNTIYLSSFLGDLVWSYDVANSEFFTNNGLTGATISEMNITYSNNDNIVGVVGKLSSEISGISSFYFQLNLEDGTPYFPNRNSNVPETEKYKNYFITNKNGLDSSANKAFMDENGTVFIVNDNASLVGQNANGVSGNVSVLNSRNLSISNVAIDDTLISNISNNVLKSIVEVEKGVYALTTVDNNTNPTKIQMNLINNSFSLIGTQSGNFYNFNDVNISNVVWNVGVLNSPNNNGDKDLILPIIGNSGKLVKFEYRSKNITNNSDITINKQIDYIDYDQINGDVYFTSNDGLNKYSLKNAGSMATIISSDSNSKNAKLAIFNTTDNTNSTTNLLLSKNKTLKGIKNVQNSSGETTLIDVVKPEIKDFKEQANTLKYNEKLAGDLNNDDVKKLLSISNVSTENYKAELVQLNGDPYTDETQTVHFNVDNINGFIEFRFKLEIKNWWTDNSFYTRLLPAYKLDGFRKYNEMTFQLVTIPSINKTKYEEQQKLLSNQYATDFTSKQIFDYFIEQGSGVGISESDINIYKIDENGNEIGKKDDNKQINVKEDINKGLISIEYIIKKNEGSTSIGNSNIRGSADFKTSKKLDDYKQISADAWKLQSLKTQKSILDLTTADLIETLYLSNGYSQKVSQWTWTPSHQNGSAEWIQDVVNGNLNGTLTYKRDSNVPDKVVDSHLSVRFSSTDYGQQNVASGLGFLSLADKFGMFSETETTTNPFFEVDEKLANSWSVSKSVDEIKNEFGNEMSKFIKTKNPWVDTSKLEWKIDEAKSTPNKVHMVVKLSPNTQTNILLSDGSHLTLTNEWVNALKNNSKSAKLFEPIEFELGASLAVFEWKNDIGSNQTFTNASTTQADLGVNKLSGILPSNYVNSYSKQDGIGYLEFQEKTNLLKLTNGSYIETPTKNIKNSTISTNENTTKQENNISQFVVKNIDLVPDDETGTVTANYTLYYPQLNTYRVASLNLRGFISVNDIIAFWMVIIVVAAIVLFAIWLALHIIKKEKKKIQYFQQSSSTKTLKKLKK